MKNLLNLEGVKALSKMEQKSINGGVYMRCGNGDEHIVGSCSDWSLNHFCGNSGGTICVGEIQ